MHAPRTTHLNVIDRILRYLKGTPGKKIWMKNNNSNEICGYFDANWARSFDREWTTGFYIFVGGKAINKTLWLGGVSKHNTEPWHQPRVN
jgi:hypothetical protein